MAGTGRTWTKFEETRGVTIAGWRDTLREIAERKARAKGKGETESRAIPKAKAQW